MRTFILYTEDVDAASEEIETHGGRVTQICTSDIIISNLPDEFEPSLLTYSTVSIPDDLGDMSRLFVDAWNTEIEEKEETIKKWDEEGYQYPKNRFSDPELAEQFKIYPPTTSSYMIGSVAVGLVIVSGSESSLKFSQSETNNTIAQVLSGLQSLASFEPLAQITFVYQTSLLSIDAKPQPNCPSTTSCEANWRDPALKLLGCSPGLPGVNEYNERLVAETKTRWAYTAFFTKYPQGWFAYAGSGRICMEYSNDNWGQSNIHKVFAHETGHIFGAADEYASSNCSCADSGYYQVPNYNCDNCTSSFPKVSCLMKGNDLNNLCSWSRGQLGWPYKIILIEKSNVSPVFTMINDLLYLGWTGTDGQLNIISSSDGITWNNKGTLSQTSKVGPGLVTMGNTVYFAWTGTDGYLNVVSSVKVRGDVWAWDQKVTLSEKSSVAPALTAMNGTLYLGWTGSDSRLNVLSSTNGKDWGNKVTLSEKSNVAPALTAMNGTLYLGWTGRDSRLNLLSSTDGKNWGNKAIFSEKSNAGPTLTVMNGILYLGWTGRDKQLNVMLNVNNIL